MLATFFQWTIQPGREDEFFQTWNEGIVLLLKEGSLGSTFFCHDHSRVSALARWPEADTHDAELERVRDYPVFARMRECVGETLRRDDSHVISNKWRLL